MRLPIRLERLCLRGFDNVAVKDADANNTRSNNIIDVGKHEKEGSLIIMDSVKGYFGSDNNYNNTDLTEFVKQLVKKAESTG